MKYRFFFPSCIGGLFDLDMAETTTNITKNNNPMMSNTSPMI